MAAANVVVDAAGAATCGAGLTCTAATMASRSALTGARGRSVNVTMPSFVQLTNGTDDTMTATLATVATLDLGGTAATGTNQAFGGSLAVGIAQADGLYSSPDGKVTVDYQ